MTNQRPKHYLGKLGIRLTKLYLVALFGGIPVLAYLGIVTIGPVTLNEIGDFLAGAFGPLAIFWLVLGFFQQGDELRHSVEALKLQAEELKNSVEQQKAMVGFTEKQLQLDIEVRNEQSQVTLAQQLPFFQLRTGGATHSGKESNYHYYIKNIGADSIDTKLFVAEDTGYALKGPIISGFQKNTEFQFTIADKNGTQLNPNADPFIEIRSKNIRGQVQVQKFALEDQQPVLISSDIE